MYMCTGRRKIKRDTPFQVPVEGNGYIYYYKQKYLNAVSQLFASKCMNKPRKKVSSPVATIDPLTTFICIGAKRNHINMFS